MVARKKWNEISSRNRKLISVAGIVEVVLLAAALVDIKRRPAEKIRGPKWMWSALAFVNIIGPLAYFVFGRRRGGAAV